MIDMSKKYQTRDGRAVRILCTDAKLSTKTNSNFPVVGLIIHEHGPDLVATWRLDGTARARLSGLDLVIVPVVAHKYMPVFSNGALAPWSTATPEDAYRAIRKEELKVLAGLQHIVLHDGMFHSMEFIPKV